MFLLVPTPILKQGSTLRWEGQPIREQLGWNRYNRLTESVSASPLIDDGAMAVNNCVKYLLFFFNLLFWVSLRPSVSISPSLSSEARALPPLSLVRLEKMLRNNPDPWFLHHEVPEVTAAWIQPDYDLPQIKLWNPEHIHQKSWIRG